MSDINPDDKAISALVTRSIEIEDAISLSVATDEAGLIAQIRFLAHFHQDWEWGQYGDRIAENLITGIATLAAKGGAS